MQKSPYSVTSIATGVSHLAECELAKDAYQIRPEKVFGKRRNYGFHLTSN